MRKKTHALCFDKNTMRVQTLFFLLISYSTSLPPITAARISPFLVWRTLPLMLHIISPKSLVKLFSSPPPPLQTAIYETLKIQPGAEMVV